MRFLFLIVSLLLLSGCDVQGTDPAALVSEARSLQARATGIVAATNSARYQREMDAAIEAQATRAAISARQTAQSIEVNQIIIQSTGTAYVQQASINQATVDAVMMSATNQSIQATAVYTYTRTALVVNMQTTQSKADAERVSAWAQAMFYPAAGVGAAIAFLLLLWRFWGVSRAWIHQRQSVRGSGFLVMAYDPIRGERQWLMIDGPQGGVMHQSPISADGFIDVTASDVYPEQPQQVTSARLLETLLEQAIDNGWTGDQIPGYRSLDGWDYDLWRRAIMPLAGSGVVETGSGGSVNIVDRFDSTEDLLDAIRSRRIKIRPDRIEQQLYRLMELCKQYHRRHTTKGE